MFKLYFAFLLCLIQFARAQPQGVVAKFTFNNGKAENDLNTSKAKASSLLLLDDRFGNPHSACYFHGSSGSYLNLGVSPILKREVCSISLWIKMEIAIYGGKGFQFNPIIVTKNNNGEDFCEAYTISYDFNNKKIIFTCDKSEEHAVRASSRDTLSLRKWHHLVLAFNDDSLYAYVDGKLNAKLFKGFKSEYLVTDSVMIANTASKKNERYYSGYVDDILFFDHVLSPEEVNNLYNSPDPNRNHIYLTWAGWFLAILCCAGLLSVIIIKILKRKYEKEREISRMNSRLLELETKAVRSQMNPHFIFNSLNTLMRFILEEDFTNSHLYLTKFSLLLRKLLESSSYDSISLSEEIDILNMYIDIEKLRFENVFRYRIHCRVKEPDKVRIPFMLVQPFVENAIWHGLLHKDGDCVLLINFTEVQDNNILCTIEDNGVGRSSNKPGKENPKKRSLAIDLVQQRLNLLQSSTGSHCSLIISDLKNPATGEPSGTRVEISIPKLNM